MSTLVETVQSILAEKLSARVEIEDESHLHAGHAGARGGGKHLRARVISPAFEGKPLVARHRMVNAALAELMANGTIHALALETKTPTE